MNFTSPNSGRSSARRPCDFPRAPSHSLLTTRQIASSDLSWPGPGLGRRSRRRSNFTPDESPPASKNLAPPCKNFVTWAEPLLVLSPTNSPSPSGTAIPGCVSPTRHPHGWRQKQQRSLALLQPKHSVDLGGDILRLENWRRARPFRTDIRRRARNGWILHVGIGQLTLSRVPPFQSLIKGWILQGRFEQRFRGGIILRADNSQVQWRATYFIV